MCWVWSEHGGEWEAGARVGYSGGQLVEGLAGLSFCS